MKRYTMIKYYIKNCKNSEKSHIRYIYRFFAKSYWLIRNVKNFFGANNRAIIRMQLFSRNQLHQTTTLTALNRYPEVFSACKEYFKGKEDIRILSYGCSTGEEVLTLRDYFPSSVIVGADINKNCISICKDKIVDEKMIFILSTDKYIMENGPYDAIFCMAVLQRKPHVIAKKGITNIKNIYPFTRFNQQLIILDKYLKKNGLLIVHYTQYLFSEATISNRYTSYGQIDQKYYVSPVFDKSGSIIAGISPQKSIYIKNEYSED